MNQVKENQVEQVYRRNKVIEGIMMVLQALSVNDVVNEKEVEKLAEEIESEETKGVRSGLVEQTYGDSSKKGGLKKDIEATVSEKAAKKKADEVRKQNEEQKDNDLQK